MARILSLRKTEQQVAELEQRVADLSQQLSSIVSSCHDIYGAMEMIEDLSKRLPTAEYLTECATAAQQMARALDGVR